MAYNSAVDTRALLSGLSEYRNSLEKHVAQLTVEHQQLEQRWHAFSAVAEGDYADQFRAGWLRTNQQFKRYINQSEMIKALLNERINDLEALNKGGSF